MSWTICIYHFVIYIYILLGFPSVSYETKVFKKFVRDKEQRTLACYDEVWRVVRCFEFKVFLLLGTLPYQSKKALYLTDSKVRDRFLFLLRAWAQNETQTYTSWIWTHVTQFISSGANRCVISNLKIVNQTKQNWVNNKHRVLWDQRSQEAITLLKKIDVKNLETIGAKLNKI